MPRRGSPGRTQRKPRRLLCASLFASARIIETIADAQFSQQNLGPIRVGLDLLAQLADENSQVLRIIDVSLPPNILEQVLMGNDLAGMLRQNLKQAIFLGRQIEALAVKLHRAGREID